MAEDRAAIQKLGSALRSFGLVDRFNLHDLLVRGRDITVSQIERSLKQRKEDIPEGIPIKFIARSIVHAIARPQIGGSPLVRLGSIRSGKLNAGRYHEHVFELLKYVFADILSRSKMEQKMDGGRRRADVKFHNSASGGFFRIAPKNLAIPSSWILFECKNYSRDLKNPQLDQISSYLNRRRGKLAFGVCRKIYDKVKMQLRLIDIARDQEKFIMLLDDADLRRLVAFRAKGQMEAIDDFLYEKLDELLA